jgi:hypothetical protein
MIHQNKLEHSTTASIQPSLKRTHKACKHYASLTILAKEKRSSLFWHRVIDEQKFFLNMAPGCRRHRVFSPQGFGWQGFSHSPWWTRVRRKILIKISVFMFVPISLKDRLKQNKTIISSPALAQGILTEREGSVPLTSSY